MEAGDATRILARLRERRDDMAAFLRELVLAESPSTVPHAQDRVFRLLAEALEEAGFRGRRVAGERTGGALLATPARRRKGPYQLLIGHADTVWPLGAAERSPADGSEVWHGSPVGEGAVLRGPGAFDMKGGLVQAVFALRTLAELGLNPAVTPVLFVTSDEEIGSPESRRHILRLARHANRALVVEPALGLEGRLKTTRKGAVRFSLRVAGRGAHGGLAPEQGASAVLELAHVVQRLYELEDPERGITVNVGRIEGGSRPNVVAAEARAEVDVRVRSLEDARRVERAVRSFEATTPGTRLVVEGGLGRPPLERTPANVALWEAARGVASRLGIEVLEGEAGGVSDGNLTSLHTPTLDGLGAVGDGAHAAHEFVYLDRMPERAALLAGLLLLPPLTARRDGEGR